MSTHNMFSRRNIYLISLLSRAIIVNTSRNELVWSILTSDMLCDVDKKISICGLILGFMTVVVNCVKPKSTTSLNLVATVPRSDKHV